MKNITRRSKKLAVAAETVRTLETQHLGQIAGGQKPTTTTWTTTSSQCGLTISREACL